MVLLIAVRVSNAAKLGAACAGVGGCKCHHFAPADVLKTTHFFVSLERWYTSHRGRVCIEKLTKAARE